MGIKFQKNQHVGFWAPVKGKTRTIEAVAMEDGETGRALLVQLKIVDKQGTEHLVNIPSLQIYMVYS